MIDRGEAFNDDLALLIGEILFVEPVADAEDAVENVGCDPLNLLQSMP